MAAGGSRLAGLKVEKLTAIGEACIGTDSGEIQIHALEVRAASVTIVGGVMIGRATHENRIDQLDAWKR
jgi:hypothetical protein